jgi:hypothetical protein
MKKMMKVRNFTLRPWRAILAFTGIFFGFHSLVAAQYGAIETTFRINGNVFSEACSTPAKSIKVSIGEFRDNSAMDMYAPAALTDSNGNFSVPVYGYFNRDNLQVSVQGNGENSAYHDTIFVVPVSACNFQRKDGGHWQIEYENKVPLRIGLNSKGVPPCLDTPALPDPITIADLPVPDTAAIIASVIDTGVFLQTKTEPAGEPLLRSLITVFPNPNNGSFTAEFESLLETDATLYILDDRNRIVMQRDIHIYKGLNRTLTEMAGHPAGNYFLRIHGQNIEFAAKLICM